MKKNCGGGRTIKSGRSGTMTPGQHRRQDVLQPFGRLGRSPHAGCHNGSEGIECGASLGFIKAELTANCCDIHRSVFPVMKLRCTKPRFADSELLCSKGVAIADISGLQALLEPADALLGAAMGKNSPKLAKCIPSVMGDLVFANSIA